MIHIKIFEAFAGYGSQSMALKRIAERHPDFSFEVVGISEIDDNAIKAYQLVHGKDIPNYGDITKIDWDTVRDFDLFTYSFPCTDLSQAGRQEGMKVGSGTRSSLLWECERAIEAKRPKYLMMENVSALISKKFMPDLQRWMTLLDNYGYKSFLAPSFPTPWDTKAKTREYCINARHYGIPQNRERVFMISVLRSEEKPNPQYAFPEPYQLNKHLIDVLEDEVEEKYFVSDKMLSYFRRVSNDSRLGKSTTTT